MLQLIKFLHGQRLQLIETLTWHKPDRDLSFSTFVGVGWFDVSTTALENNNYSVTLLKKIPTSQTGCTRNKKSGINKLIIFTIKTRSWKHFHLNNDFFLKSERTQEWDRVANHNYLAMLKAVSTRLTLKRPHFWRERSKKNRRNEISRKDALCLSFLSIYLNAKSRVAVVRPCLWNWIDKGSKQSFSVSCGLDFGAAFDGYWTQRTAGTPDNGTGSLLVGKKYTPMIPFYFKVDMLVLFYLCAFEHGFRRNIWSWTTSHTDCIGTFSRICAWADGFGGGISW